MYSFNIHGMVGYEPSPNISKMLVKTAKLHQISQYPTHLSVSNLQFQWREEHHARAQQTNFENLIQQKKVFEQERIVNKKGLTVNP